MLWVSNYQTFYIVVQLNIPKMWIQKGILFYGGTFLLIRNQNILAAPLFPKSQESGVLRQYRGKLDVEGQFPPKYLFFGARCFPSVSVCSFFVIIVKKSTLNISWKCFCWSEESDVVERLKKYLCIWHIVFHYNFILFLMNYILEHSGWWIT